MAALSVVIPTYEAQQGLQATLAVLGSQVSVDQLDIEVIVVDDGSSDSTRRVAEQARQRLPGLKYIFRARDHLSCRARARNLGVRAATGKLILFLDAGVLPGPGLLRKTIASAQAVEPAATICLLLGVWTPADEAQKYQGDLDQLLSDSASLRASMRWADVREPYLRAARACAQRIPALWLLAWSGALVLPRQAILESGGFDESFRGWGAEDVDLAGRLAARGLAFQWFDDVVAICVPRARAETRELEHTQNAGRLHANLACRESELFAFWQDGFATNLFAARLDTLDLGILTPPSALPAAALGKPAPRTLCTGLRWSATLLPLQPSVALVHERSLSTRLRELWPNARVECALGVMLSFSDAEFDRAIVGDLLRMLPKPVQRQYLTEMSRVAREVWLLFSSRGGHESGYRQLSGWPWAAPEEMTMLAGECGMSVVSAVEGSNDTLGMVVLAHGNERPTAAL